MSVWDRVLGRPERPPHCRRCGDAMQRMNYVASYNRDGSAKVWSGWHCPRVPARSEPWEDGGSGYKHDCIPPPPLVNWTGEPPPKAAVEQQKRMAEAWRNHRPWQDAL